MTSTQNVDEYWSELYDTGRDYRYITPGELSKLLDFAAGATSKTCLDIGSGTGQLTRELFHRGYQCVGVDAAASAVRIADSLTVVLPEKLRYLQFDIEQDDDAKLPYAPYALITCKFVYAFIKDKPAFLDKVGRLLQPDGIFVVITSHVQDLPPERRSIGVDDSELAALSEAFEQIACYKGDELGGALTYFVGRSKRILKT
jgi:2-polyprenyl-3-methyl-5-hydroxy-6-metoxy-1,4-benzoquinol methylase